MKKTITLLLFFAAIVLSFSLNAKTVTVTTATEFTNALSGATDERDTILVAPGKYALSNKAKIPTAGLTVIRSAVPDDRAILQMEMGGSIMEAGAERPSLIFEDIHLQGRHSPYTAGSGYIIHLNEGTYMNLDTLAFRNCEISNASYCIFRSAAASANASAGEIEHFEISDCIIHEMSSATHSRALVYYAHVPMYVIFRNNTFFDIPYLKSIFLMNRMENETGRSSEITFENNTVITTHGGTDGLISTGKYLGEEAQFFINNNLILLPDWVDDFTISPEDPGYRIPPVIKCQGGIISAKNNVIDGLLPWSAGESFDEDGEGGFLVIDTVNTYKMADIDLSWEDFADHKNGDFTYLSTEQLATAGTEGGPVGDPRWLKALLNPRILTVAANLEEAEVTPKRAYYEDGSLVTVSASEVDGYDFTGWKSVSNGTILSADNPYTFTITSDMDIQAVYEIIAAKNVEVIINGSNTATYTITPDKDVYYLGDEITIALKLHYLNNFLGWSDGNQELIRTETIKGDLTLTANFAEENYIVAWDFDHFIKNGETITNLAANHAFDPANAGVMNYINSGEIANLIARTGKYNGEGKELHYGVVRRIEQERHANPDYIYIQFSTKDITGLKVKSRISSDNSIFATQKMQYSLDGINYTDFATLNIPADWNEVWYDFDGELPAEAENQENVYVRWIPDTSSGLLNNAVNQGATTEFVYLAAIIVTSDDLSTPKKVEVNINGSNTATYTITPEKDEYNVGDEVTIALKLHYLNEFLGWSDGNQELVRTETITGNLILTANFKEDNYVVAWDFDQLTKNNETFTNLAANHAIDPANTGVMNYINSGQIANLSTRNGKYNGEGKELHYGVVRRIEVERHGDPDYIYIQFSTKNLKNLKVKSKISSDNTVFARQKMQYSLDGINYTDFATFNMPAGWNEIWYDFEGELPAAAANQEAVYVRWIPDTSSELLNNAANEGKTTEFIYLAAVVVTSDDFSSLDDINTDNANRIFASGDILFIEAGTAGIAEIYTVMGQKAGRVILNEGWNEFSGLPAGIYIVRIGDQIQKVLIQ